MNQKEKIKNVATKEVLKNFRIEKKIADEVKARGFSISAICRNALKAAISKKG